jgi:hypothetical protein
LIDELRCECRVVHVEHDDSDGGLKQHVEQQDEDGPESDDVAYSKVRSTEKERAVPHRLIEIARLLGFSSVSTVHGDVRIVDRYRELPLAALPSRRDS